MVEKKKNFVCVEYTKLLGRTLACSNPGTHHPQLNSIPFFHLSLLKQDWVVSRT